MKSSDLWWLTSEDARKYNWINLFHQKPYSDEPDTDRDPLSCPMLSNDKRYSLESMSTGKAKFCCTNVFRSFALYTSDTGNEELIGPFLLDIDRVTEKGGGYFPDFDTALQDTRTIIKDYCSCLQDNDYRIFFSGHKGFHIEINPRAIRAPDNKDRWQYFENKRNDINKKYGNDFIDKFHD